MSRNQLAQRSDGRFKVNYKNKQFYGKSKKEALRNAMNMSHWKERESTTIAATRHSRNTG